MTHRRQMRSVIACNTHTTQEPRGEDVKGATRIGVRSFGRGILESDRALHLKPPDAFDQFKNAAAALMPAENGPSVKEVGHRTRAINCADPRSCCFLIPEKESKTHWPLSPDVRARLRPSRAFLHDGVVLVNSSSERRLHHCPDVRVVCSVWASGTGRCESSHRPVFFWQAVSRPMGSPRASHHCLDTSIQLDCGLRFMLH